MGSSTPAVAARSIGLVIGIVLCLWPVHERVLGTDVSCGATYRAVAVQAGSTDGITQGLSPSATRTRALACSPQEQS